MSWETGVMIVVGLTILIYSRREEISKWLPKKKKGAVVGTTGTVAPSRFWKEKENEKHLKKFGSALGFLLIANFAFAMLFLEVYKEWWAGGTSTSFWGINIALLALGLTRHEGRIIGVLGLVIVVVLVLGTIVSFVPDGTWEDFEAEAQAQEMETRTRATTATTDSTEAKAGKVVQRQVVVPAFGKSIKVHVPQDRLLYVDFGYHHDTGALLVHTSKGGEPLKSGPMWDRPDLPWGISWIAFENVADPAVGGVSGPYEVTFWYEYLTKEAWEAKKAKERR